MKIRNNLILMDTQALKNLLRRYSLKPNFTYGQNFLLDDEVLDEIVSAAAVTSADQILEIGPGIGNLTRRLCEKALNHDGTGQAGFVLSIEKDPKFLPILKAIKKDYPKNFRYEIADALEFDFQQALSERRMTVAAELNAESNVQRPISVPISDLSASYKVVANIPYYITGKILEMFMTAKLKPATIVVLTQKEVAERITARAGDLSLLAISVQLFGNPKIIKKVPAKSFYPAPKVDSAIVRIDLPEEPKYKIDNEKNFFRILRACFSGKRKQLHNTLVNNLGIDKHQVFEILAKLKINPASRPQELTIEKWIDLHNKILNPKL